MKTGIYRLAILAGLFALGAPVQAQQKYYLAQIANGTFSGGSYRMTFIVVNNSSQTAIVNLTLTDDNGSPMTVTIPGSGTNASFTLSLPSGASRFLQTDGTGTLTAGAATVISTAPVNVSALFAVYDTAGKFLTEAGVGSSDAAIEFVIPVDTTGTFNTGVALFNSGTGTANLTASLQDLQGQSGGSTTFSLGAGKHLARFVSGTGQLFPTAANFRGTLVLRSSAPVVAVTLRQNGTPLSYTSLPAVARSAGQNQVILSQVANGRFSGGIFKTSFLIFNMSASAASVVVNLTADNGTNMPVTIPGRGTAATFTVALPVNGSAFLETDGSGTLAAGAATIVSNQPIGASAIFTVMDTSQRFLTEAGVGDSPVLTQFTLPVDMSGTFDTGVAFFNPITAQPNPLVSMTATLVDSSGTAVGSTQLSVPLRNHTARFVSEMFPGRSNFRGSLAIVTTGGGIAAVTLRQNSSPLTYTTLPVATGVAVTGTPSSKVLLSKSRTGVSALSDGMLSESLVPGYKISGAISGSGYPFMVAAVAGDGSYYAGRVEFLSGKYLIVVPSGTYNVMVCFTPPSSGAAFTTYKDPAAVTVTANVTRNLTLPTPAMYPVSGTVNGLATLASLSTPALYLTSGDAQNWVATSVGSNGSFQCQLPNGSYTATLTGEIKHTATQTQGLNLYNLSTLTVTGAPLAGRTIDVPATARLTGTVKAAGLTTLPSSTSVAATDTSLPTQGSSQGCAFPTSTASVTVDPAGPFQLVLTNNRNYSLALHLPVMQGSTDVGTVYYPTSGVQRTLAGNGVNDFNVPALPGFVVFTGKVTDDTGQGVDDVDVTFSSPQITGTTNLTYAAGATTDASGSYRVVLLSGVSYTVHFTPATPAP